jgi:predicted nucleic acid-binding protein
VADEPETRGLLDTSVVVDLDRVRAEDLPSQMAVSAVTLAELAAGPHATDDLDERARRQQRLQLTEATFDAIPFDSDCARAYGRVYAHTRAAGRKARGRRAMDLLIAATALAAELPLHTANPADLDGLSELITIVPVRVAAAAGPGQAPDTSETHADVPDENVR